MLKKNNFFQKFPFQKKSFNNNLRKTRKAFESLKIDLNNFEIPMMESYEKNYNLGFSQQTIKRFSKYKNIIIIGMGGSISGTKSIYSFFKKKIKKKLFFFDSLDTTLHLEFKKIKNLKNSCFIIVSKSGNTIETIVNLGIIYPKIKEGKKIIFITGMKDSNLASLANNFNAEVIEHKPFIGGRYSVMSEVSMFPAALMGLKINKFKNLNKLIKNKNFIDTLIKNVASIFTLNNKGIKNSVLLNYDSDLNDLGDWYQQLIAESLGKNGKGITPILSYGPKYHHSVLQLYLDGPRDKFFTFLNSTPKQEEYKISQNLTNKSLKFIKNKNLNFIKAAQLNAVKSIFKIKKIPFRQITFNKKNEEELGNTFTFFVLETILLSRLMNTNPFNQPAVEQVKIKTKNYLS